MYGSDLYHYVAPIRSVMNNEKDNDGDHRDTRICGECGNKNIKVFDKNFSWYCDICDLFTHKRD